MCPHRSASGGNGGRTRGRRLAVLAPVLTALALAGPTAARAAHPPRLYIALGDSVTRAESETGQNYPERFFAHLRAVGAADRLSNLGSSGETSESIRGASLTKALTLIRSPDTDTTAVTIDVGGNDVLLDSSCTPTSSAFSFPACRPRLESIAENHDALLAALDSALVADPGGASVLVMTYYNPWSGRAGEEAAAAKDELMMLGSDRRLDCAATGLARGLNDAIACAARAHGASVADVYPSFLGHGATWFADAIHPNDAGQAAIATTFVAAYDLRARVPPCHAGRHADRACTSGATFRGVRARDVCRPGWGRGHGHVTPSQRRRVFRRYGIPDRLHRGYELDHLIPLGLGGDDSDRNLWPEPARTSRAKDRLERGLHHAVCAGRLRLRVAQRRIVAGWSRRY